MKILVVQESDWIKRGPHQQHHLMERLSLLGHEVRVIDYPILWKEDKGGLFKKGELFEHVSKYYSHSRVDVIRPPLIRLPFFDMLSVPLFHPYIIYKQLRNFKPDIIIGFGILNTFFANVLAKIHNVPFVYYLIDSLHALIENNIYSRLAKFIEKSTLNNSDNILTINKALRDYTVEMGATPNLVQVIPAGIDIEKFKKMESTSTFRNKLGIGNDDIVLFFMGWLYDFSGLLEVADAITNYRGNLPLKLLIVGKGDIYDDLVIASKYDRNIILTGWVDYSEIPLYLSISDVCILPAYKNKIMKDIVPIKIYEYLASSKPVVATNLEGLVKEFGHSSGILYIDDQKDLIPLVEDIFLKDEYGSLSKSAYNTASKHAWDSITVFFENYLLKCVEG